MYYTERSKLEAAVIDSNEEEIKKILIELALSEDFYLSGEYNEISEILPEQYKQLIAYYLFSVSLHAMSTSIIIDDKSETKFSSNPPIFTTPPFRIIYNNDQYTDKIPENLPESTNLIKGKALNLDETPIGYNIHLPEDREIKGVFFEVYGGMNFMYHEFMSTREEQKKLFLDFNSFHPGQLQKIQERLLDKGIVIVTLNLPDLLELDVNQSKLPEDLHNKIHACIDQAYSTLHDHPESLHPDLSVLKEMPFTLSGMSFGGRTAAMHASLYPGTFNNYLSVNGAISNEMTVKSDLPDKKGSPLRTYLKHLDPAQNDRLKNITEPVLIIHTRNDNNLNVKTAIDFYQKMQEHHKGELANLIILDKGGHAYIDDPYLLPDLTTSIADFIQHGPSELPALHQWRSYRHDILANQFYGEATTTEKFISYLHQTNEIRFLKKNLGQFEDLWASKYVTPLACLCYAEKIAHDEKFLSSEIKHLIENISADEALNTLNHEKNIFLTWLKEINERLLSVGYKQILFSDEDLKQLSPEFILDLYKQQLSMLADKPDEAQYFISQLYLSNPRLLELARNSYPSIENEFQALIPEAKTALYNSAKTEKKMILNTWKEAILNAADKKTKQEKSEDYQSKHAPKKPKK